jgi:adenosylmethionine-8-amino-7-oxononanoate aminotransferase
MPNPLSSIIPILDLLGKELKILPATGGAVEDLQHPDQEEIEDAAYDQMLKMQFTPTHELSIPKIKLSKKLADITPGSLSKVFFALSGSGAVETAIKLVRKYQQLSGFRNKFKIIGSYAFHGFTYGAMSSGWIGDFIHKDFEPLLPGFLHVASPKCPICDFGLEYPSCNILCARYIEKIIQKEHPDTVAAFLDVPVSKHGYVNPPEYWPIVRSICDKYGMLLILDEVFTGFGRTGKMFACEHWGVVPDIMVVAKGLAGSYMPISATIVTKEVAKKFEGGANEVLTHSVTSEGHPVSCAAALATIEIIERKTSGQRRGYGEIFVR